MSADLYTDVIRRPLFDKYQLRFEAALREREASPGGSKLPEAAKAEVEKYYELMNSEGCFRDSYNATGVLNRLGLSWWQDVMPLLTKTSNLRQDNLCPKGTFSSSLEEGILKESRQICLGA